MTKLKKNFRVLTLAALSLLILGGAAALAQRQLRSASVMSGRPMVKVTLTGSVMRDQTRLPIEKVTSVNPGEILDWTITSENDGNAPAHDYKTVGQIPKGTMLVAGSTTSDGSAKVAYSIDNGKTFSAQPMIEEKQSDGSTRLVPAPVSMYTQVRYEWADPLTEGGKLQASYKVRVK